MTALDHDWYPRPLPDNVVIGERSWLYSTFAFRHFCSLREPAITIGNDTGVYNGTFFELGPNGRLTIGDVTTIVGAIIRTEGEVRIGDYAFIAHEVVIADEPFAAPPPGTAGAAGEGSVIVIEDDVWIGAGAIVVGGVTIGAGSIVGAGAVVTRSIPPMTVAAGNPARTLGRVGAAGPTRDALR
jgi:acetyltransferase-like isoleucine patch superfamily enzyme